MAENGDWAARALESWASLADGTPRYMRLVMGDFPAGCRCEALGDRKCRAPVTAEDLLCDTCRGGNCCAMNIGGEWLDRHQEGPVVTWESTVGWDWGNARAVTWTAPLDGESARIALGDADG